MNDSRFNSLKSKKPKNNRGRNWVNLKNIENNNFDEPDVEPVIEPDFPNYEIEPTYDTEELDNEDIIDIDFDELVQNSNRTNESTPRLAVLHFDFDHYPLSHLANMVKSFLPETGKIKSITKYPTEEYMERYEEDIMKGPKEYLNQDPDTKKYKIYRKYQISRLKFFLTVFEFDSIESADLIYNELDGQNLGDSGLKLDLRYVSVDRQFNIPDRFKHLVEKLNPNLSKFKSVDFKTSCFATTAVKNDWGIDHKRDEAIRREFQGSDNELSDYIATDSESGSDSNKSDDIPISDNNDEPTIKRCNRKRPYNKSIELLGEAVDEMEQKVEHESEKDEEESESESDENEYELDGNANEMSNSELDEGEDNEKETEKKSKKISQRVKKKLILKEKSEKKETELREKREYLKSFAGSDVAFDGCKDFLHNPKLYKIDRSHPKYLNALLAQEFVLHGAVARGISVNLSVPDLSEYLTNFVDPKNKKRKI